MIETVRSIGIICQANYCRSPVVQNLFKKKFQNLLEIDSAGINPIVSAGMDLRSIDYLKENDVIYEIHNPKKIDRHFLNSCDLVFAIDPMVLMNLNRTFKNYRNKFKLFTYKHKNIQIKDPYRMSKENYKNVMDQIKFVVDQFELEELY